MQETSGKTRTGERHNDWIKMRLVIVTQGKEEEFLPRLPQAMEPSWNHWNPSTPAAAHWIPTGDGRDSASTLCRGGHCLPPLCGGTLSWGTVMAAGDPRPKGLRGSAWALIAITMPSLLAYAALTISRHHHLHHLVTNLRIPHQHHRIPVLQLGKASFRQWMGEKSDFSLGIKLNNSLSKCMEMRLTLPSTSLFLSKRIMMPFRSNDTLLQKLVDHGYGKD